MTAPRRPVVCVYCGSRHGSAPSYTAAARALGTAIGAQGADLVYGGGRVGLMGEVADAALAVGAAAFGVIPDSLMRREVGHAGLTELHVVPDMHERKRMMAERADAFIALPGGIGTLEELYEVWTWRQLGYHAKPIGLLNVDGYFDPLWTFMERTVAEGFLDATQLALVQKDDDPARLLQRLLAAAPPAAAGDYSQI
jgi:uncharacterized protein (TIGR00730 family)